MSNKKRLFWGILLCSLLAGARWGFSQSEKKAAVPRVSLDLYGQTSFSHDAREPLLLSVGISNPQGLNVQLANEQALRSKAWFEKEGRLENLSEEKKKRLEETFQTKEVPAFALGSDSLPVRDLVAFEAKDPAGKEILLRSRPLATTLRLAGGKSFDATGFLVLYYGLDPEALAKLPEGDYEIRAVLNTEKEKGMWQGKAVSPPVKMTLKKALEGLEPGEANGRDYLSGTFYRLDEQFDKMLFYAERILSRIPDSIEAWELRGDAWAGQEKYEEAEQAFAKGLDLFWAKHPNLKDNEEPPRYLLSRLEDVQRKRTHG